MDSVINRLTDAFILEAAVNERAGELVRGFDAEVWLADPNNTALMDGENIVLCERENKALNIHWLLTARGREALCVGRRFIKYMFDRSDVAMIKGSTPLQKRAALWFNRQMGGKSYGIIETVHGPVELFILERAQ